MNEIIIKEPMTEWKEYKLGEIAEITSSKRIFYSEYVPDGVPFYRSKEIIDLYNKRSVSSELFITETRFDEIKNKFGVPQENDILLTSVGSLGIPYKVKKNDRFYFKDGNLTWFKDINREFLLPDYLMFWLRSSIGKQKLDEITIGSTQAALTISGLKTITIELPSIGEQKSIVSILSSLDDKIDLLHRENATLEQMAETLFRQWFVVEAKEEWEEKPLSFFGKIVCGKTPPKKEKKYFGGQIPFIKIPDMHNNVFVFNSEDTLTEEGVLSQKEKTIPPFSIIVSCIATVGLVVMNAKKAQTNQQINSIIPEKEYYRYFLFLHLRNMYEELNAMASGGTATLNLNTGNFSKILLPCPTDDYLRVFNEQVKDLFLKIYSNQKQIQTLIQTRDGLLPRLMSGEVKL